MLRKNCLIKKYAFLRKLLTLQKCITGWWCIISRLMTVCFISLKAFCCPRKIARDRYPTVPFRSIRQAPLRVTHLLKFWFRHFGQPPLHRTKKFGRWPPEAQKFGVYGVGPAKIFSTLPKWLLAPLHFGDLRGPVTRYCRIDQNRTVYSSKHLGSPSSMLMSISSWLSSQSQAEFRRLALFQLVPPKLQVFSTSSASSNSGLITAG
jgi:hypothetical protein